MALDAELFHGWPKGLDECGVCCSTAEALDEVFVAVSERCPGRGFSIGWLAGEIQQMVQGLAVPHCVLGALTDWRVDWLVSGDRADEGRGQICLRIVYDAA